MWKVEGDHPTNKRPDAWFMYEEDAELYASQIKKFDYVNVKCYEDILNMEISEIQKDVHNTAVEKGWHDEGQERTFGDIIALCHSELSEALEEVRKHGTGNVNVVSYQENPGKDPKPVGVPIELADCIIRILDYCGLKGINMQEALKIKLTFNKGRSHRHGGKHL